MVSPPGSPFAQNLPAKPLAEALDGYLFEYRKTADSLVAIAERGQDRALAPIIWIFGSGRQGQTPVATYQGHFVEHRVSFYSAAGYGITIGQENGASANAVKALGWQMPDRDAHACFGCHSTSPSDDLTRLTPGVQCIRCHAGAERHATDAQSGGHEIPVNPGKLDHLAQVQLCGACHRTKPPSGNEDDIANIRFQPLRLMKSACFQKSQIACTTCHPAHRNAVRNEPAVYNRACAGCHENQMAHIAQQKSDNCIACHMPKASPAPALTFTDHFIRVVSVKTTVH